MNGIDYTKKINNAIFIKIVYTQSVSYLFFDDQNTEVVYSLSLFTNTKH